ncbi:MAG: HEAT repeat domain-containing protein [Bacteroidota bacterium]
MKESILENQLINYLEGSLSEAEKAEVENALTRSESLQKKLAEFKELFEGMDQLLEEKPSQQLDENFYRLLKEEQQQAHLAKIPNNTLKHVNMVPNIWTVAAAVALLVGGLFIGWQLSNQSNQKVLTSLKEEIQTTKEMMFALLQQESASNRIKAINISQNFQQVDDDIINALIHTLNNDQSNNVKLAAIEALSHFSSVLSARKALIHALGEQNNPVVQIELITTLVAIEEKQACTGQ